MRDVRDIPSQQFTISSFSEVLSMDCNNSADAVICDVLGTLIQELDKQGIIRATITT